MTARSSVPARNGLLAACLTALLCPCPGTAPALAEETSEKLQIFGHLTQAYGRASRGSIRGVSEDGSTDLRNLAVQFRWKPSSRDSVVVQLAHEERGDDVFSPDHDEVEVDWAFYERRLGEHTALKVGRLNIPQGIYNEVRDVGTLLPFLNLPISFYAGVLNSAETVDGVSLSHTFAPRSAWDLTADVYFGGWDTIQQKVNTDLEFGLENLDARAEDGIGLQLWLNTPVRGLRLGAGTSTWVLDGPASTAGSNDRWGTYHFSVDASFEKWIVRAEARHWRFDQNFGAFFGLPGPLEGKAERDGYYVQAGVWLTPKIGLFGQYQKTELEDSLDLAPLDDFHEVLSASLSYRFNPDLLAKIEFNTAETRFPLGLSGEMVGSDPVDVDWAIVALSVSF